MFDLIAKICECAVIFLAVLGVASLIAAIILIIIRDLKEVAKND